MPAPEASSGRRAHLCLDTCVAAALLLLAATQVACQQHLSPEPSARVGPATSLGGDSGPLVAASGGRGPHPWSNVSLHQHHRSRVNFEHLLTRILNYIGAPQTPVIHRLGGLLAISDPLKVAADVNNRTSMRFLQNNKTFASIVYTDDARQRPRKLISCHLLDLEKHTPEVGQLEAKYGLRTVRIEFRDMMQLIDCCTDIERIKPRSRLSIGLAALRALVRRSHQQNRLQQAHPAAGSAPPVAGSKRKRFLAAPSGGAQQQETSSHLSSQAHHLDHSNEAGGHRLVLGEVTAPPESTAGGRGAGLVDALQEISSYDSTDLIAIWRGILPGTNWCGMGDRASSYDHLGFEADVDICCRAHDFCPIRLSAFSGGYGLFNWSFYTRSHCWCDQNFLECLQEANSALAAVVTRFYFSIMRTACLHDNATSTDQHQHQQLVGATSRGGDLLERQQHQQLPQSLQQHLLLEQIRDAAPIPAQVRSVPVRARIDAAPTSQLNQLLHQHQHQHLHQHQHQPPSQPIRAG